LILAVFRFLFASPQAIQNIELVNIFT